MWVLWRLLPTDWMFWLMKLGYFSFVVVGVVITYFGIIRVGEPAMIYDWVILRIIGLDLGVVFLVDWIRIIFSGVVFLISGCVFLYMVGYIEGDKRILRFGLLVFLFVVSMFFVIISPRFIIILLGWDGLGLVSYCLVVYYGNYKSYNAGMITGVRNRIGDVGLLLAIGVLFMNGRWDFYLVNGDGLIWLIVRIMVIVAGFTRRAQIPFSAWLPAAMAAPTPVSALVHSSTLVTAGVYLFIRFYGVLGGVWWLILVVLYGGVLTLFMAGLRAVFEMDIRKIVALSTLRQLGIIIVSVGVGNVNLAFFHLICHAIFKALLFLCVGKMIDLYGGTQDVRYLGGIMKGSPITYVCFNIANFSLCGFPFMAGFYSKDLILESYGRLCLNVVCFIFILVGVMFTCFYTARLSWYRIIVFYNGGIFFRDDERIRYILPISTLAIGGVLGGSFFFWLGVSVQDLDIRSFGLLRVLPVLVLILGVLGSIVLVGFEIRIKNRGSIRDFWIRIWFIPSIRVELAGGPFYAGGRYLRLVDEGWGEIIGGYGVYRVIRNWSGGLLRMQVGLFSLILTFIIIWVVMVVWLIDFCLNSLIRVWLWRCQGDKIVFK